MPADAAEMVTQMLLCTPITVIKKQRGYYLVRTPDGYLSWVEGSGVVLNKFTSIPSKDFSKLSTRYI